MDLTTTAALTVSMTPVQRLETAVAEAHAAAQRASIEAHFAECTGRDWPLSNMVGRSGIAAAHAAAASAAADTAVAAMRLVEMAAAAIPNQIHAEAMIDKAISEANIARHHADAAAKWL